MIGLIWAQDADGVIGCRGKLPWNVPEDLARFKKITSGHPVVMGRKTWDSLKRALPGRTNVVISARRGPEVINDAGEGKAGQVVVARSFAQALDTAAASVGGGQIWVIGGAGVFAQAIGVADVARVTYLKGRYQGDVFAPRLEAGPSGRWIAERQEPGDGSWKRSGGGAEYRFVDYTRAGT